MLTLEPPTIGQASAVVVGLAGLYGIVRWKHKVLKSIILSVVRIRTWLIEWGVLRPNMKDLFGEDAIDPEVKPSARLLALSGLFSSAAKAKSKSLYATAEASRATATQNLLIYPFSPLTSREKVEQFKLNGLPCAWITHPDVYDPSAGTILYCHGGGYHNGFLDAYREVCGELSRRTGCRVLYVEYTLCPKATIAEARDELVMAYHYLMQETPAPKIAIVGDSAGAGYAVGILQNLRAKRFPMPGCAVMICPWVDLTMKSKSMNNNNKDSMFPHVEFFKTLAEDSVRISGKPAEHPDNSFINGPFRGFPPIYVCASKTERLLDDALAVINRAKSSGVEVTSEIAPYAMHVYPILFSFSVPEFEASLDRICSYIRENLGSA
mmetsp:Transcript_13658/g.26395  ORF Transcript_13658/g.26395 Transcript_13658/m.26395 type:complete len:380 (+) Transcript_13658:375-1514(+)